MSNLYTFGSLVDIIGYGPNKETYSIYEANNTIGIKINKPCCETKNSNFINFKDVSYVTSSVDPVSGILVLLVDSMHNPENMTTKLLFVHNWLLNEVIVTVSEIPSNLLDCEGNLLLSNDMIIGNKKHKTHRLLYRDTSYKLEAVNFKDKFLSICKENKLTLIDNSEHIAVARINYHDPGSFASAADAERHGPGIVMINNNRVIPLVLNTSSNGYRIEWKIVNNGVISIIIDSCTICIDITYHNLDGNNKTLFHTDDDWVSGWKILTCGSQVEFVQFASMKLIKEMINSWTKNYQLAIK